MTIEQITRNITVFYALFLFTFPNYAPPELDYSKGPSEIEPIRAPFPMPQLTRPEFPNRTMNIVDYGGIGDGRTLNSHAFAAAIQTCSNEGGGTVLIPPGKWLTGAIHLQSNINLHLSEGAVLKFSDNPADYLPVVFTRWAGFECYNYSPLIYAHNCENIAITGPGSIDGNGRDWWAWEKQQQETAYKMYNNQILKGISVDKRIYGTPEAGLRPQLIAPINCSNVLLEDFSIIEPGPFWTIHLTYCDGIIVRNLRVLTTGGPNTDGLNIDSSKNALIEYCYFNTGDDCICMKSGINEDGWRVGKPAENVVIRKNYTNQGHGGVVFGSDTSGGIHNIYAHDNQFHNTDIGIRLKSTRGRGGVVKDLWFENIMMSNIKTQAIRIETNYTAWFSSNGGKAPIIRDLHFRSIRCEGAQRDAIRIEGLPESYIDTIEFDDIAINAQKGIYANRVKNVQLNNVIIDSHSIPKMRWITCEDITFQN